MDYQVRLSRSARADIEDIVRYISIDSSNQALRFGRLLIRHTKTLAAFPSGDGLYLSLPMNPFASL